MQSDRPINKVTSPPKKELLRAKLKDAARPSMFAVRFYSEKLSGPISTKMALKLAFESIKRSHCSYFNFLVRDVAI